jgi:DNA-binding GntR family transcriptional regulator
VDSRERPRRAPQLSEEVAEFIRDLVIYGDLQSGEFIRLEDIAERFGCSVTPVREAMLTLRQEGFVEPAPRRGFRVSTITVEDVRDVFAIQAFIAGELVARAAERVNEEDLDRLEQIQDRLESAAKRNEVSEIELHNNAFHRTLNAVAAAPKLGQFLLMSLRYVPRRFYGHSSVWQMEAMNEHRAVLAGLREGDADRARRAMEQHILRAGRALVQQLDGRDQQGNWPPPRPIATSEPVRLDEFP